MEIYEIITSYLEKEKSGILATITGRSGSTPQGIGAKVFIDDKGKIYGTIGGGCVEAEVLQEARNLNANETKVIHYVMNNTDVADQGMVCGGNVDIFLEPVKPVHKDLYRELLSRINKSINTIVITNTAKGKYSKLLLSSDGSVFGDKTDIPPFEYFLEKLNGKQLIFTEGVLAERVSCINRLFIYGAGHISLFIARFAKTVDFNVTVIDDRITFANRERFPEADNVIAGYFTDVIKDLDLNSSDFHVIVTRGHRHDAEVLEEILKKPSFYLGMIGSKRKTKLVFDYLRSKKFGEADIKRIHAPIGIEIDAVTPQEIAVSITAELISARAGKLKNHTGENR
jgi:xanthine dehydrogenase accessory factor